MIGRRTMLNAALALALSTLCAATQVLAQGAKPLRLIVGFPAGGSSDAIARLLADAMRSRFDGPIVIENKVGAGGRIAAEFMKTADTDGSVVLLTPNPVLTIYPHIYKRLSYDPLSDLTPVAQVATYPLVIGVGPAVPVQVRTVKDYLQWSKGDPARGFYGSPAPGSTPHFVGLMLSKAGGANLSHVAYKGDAPAVQDLLGGQIPMSINVPSAQLPQLPSGRLRILATTGSKRMAQLPEVPTLAESGFPGIRTNDWFGIFVPRGTPPAAVLKLQSALREALQTKTVQEGLAKQAVDPSTATPAEFEKALREETAQWAAIVKASGFSAEE